MNPQVNVAIQVLPISSTRHPYEIVDIAIDLINKSGLKFVVTPFETVVEGDYDRIFQLIKDIHFTCHQAGAQEMICNIKIQSSSDTPVTIEDKMQKYS
jgi:uncharacterized protein (TIGR00106 family)